MKCDVDTMFIIGLGAVTYALNHYWPHAGTMVAGSTLMGLALWSFVRK